MAQIGKDIERASDLLSSGEVIGIPTETVYGLAGNALDPQAVLRIFSTKQRPQFNPLIIHVSGIRQLERWVTHVPTAARQLAEAFWPGPLTLLLPKQPNIHDLVTAGHERVAIRVPNHPLTLELLRDLEFPLAAPSANPFGYISPTTAQHVNDQLGEQIPYVLDGGPCSVGVESTIVGFETDGTAQVYRFGGLDQEMIESVIGPVAVATPVTNSPEAPGRLSSHYAPRTVFNLGGLNQVDSISADQQVGLLVFREVPPGHADVPARVLSPSGNLSEAAQNLFAAMRELDGMGLDVILAEELPESGLGRAINDRLRRAAAEHAPENS